MSLSKLLQTKPRYTRVVLALLLAVSSVVPVSAATVGVGIGTGKIRPDSQLLPGLTYSMPAIAVFNSGDVESDYEMTIQYNETQAEQRPPEDWIMFSPQTFRLKAGQSQEVKVVVHPASSAKPGDYFAYLEARPLKKEDSTATAIKIAAATKFNFSVAPANDFERAYYVLLDFWNKNQGWLLPVFALALLVAAIFVGRKFFRIERRRKKMRFSSRP